MIADVGGALFFILYLLILWYCWFDLKREERFRGRWTSITLAISIILTLITIWVVIDIFTN